VSRRELNRITLPEWLAFAAILLVGAVVRSRYLGSVSLWFDESFCVKLAQFGWGDVWRQVALDNHPPLYFYLLKAWLALWGPSLVAARSLSVLLGSLSILGGFLLVRESEAAQPNLVLRRRANQTALLAALGLATAVFQIEYAQEIRMYVLGSALTLWSSWALLRALQQPKLRGADLLLYLLLGSALSYTHYYGLFILAAQFLYAAGQVLPHSDENDSRPRRIAFLATTFAVLALLWLPWAPIFLGHRRQVEADYWSGDFRWRDLANSCLMMWTGYWSRSQPAETWTNLLTLGSFALWLAQATFGRGGTRLIGLGPCMTFACSAAASLTGRNIISPRYFQFAHALAICGFAVAIQRIKDVRLRTTAAVVWLALLCWLCRSHESRREQCARSPGYQNAVAYLQKIRDPQEPILVIRPDALCDCAAYLPGDRRVFLLAGAEPFPFYLGTAAVAPDQIISWDELAARFDRIWLIAGEYPRMEPVEIPESWQRGRHEEFLYWYRIPNLVVVDELLREQKPQAQAKVAP
jgi:hypothetical protein